MDNKNLNIIELSDKYLEKVSGGNIDDPFTAAFVKALEGVFSMDKLFKEVGGNILKIYSAALHEVYNKLDPAEQANFIAALEKMLLDNTTTDQEKQEIEKELMRILSTIKK